MANQTVFVKLQLNDSKMFALHKNKAHKNANNWKITAYDSTKKFQPQNRTTQANVLPRPHILKEAKTLSSNINKKPKLTTHLNKRNGQATCKKLERQERNRLGSVWFSEDVVNLVKEIESGRLTLEEVIEMGILPLHEAVARNMLESTKTLLELGADMSRETAGGMTPLQIAVYCGHFDTAKLLIQHGASIDRIRDGIQVF